VRESWSFRKPVLHLSIHTFTPVLRGKTRHCDIGLLFDPSRPREKSFCAFWKQELHAIAPALIVRSNYPYPGRADSFTAYLRKSLPPSKYLGIELEINQKYPRSSPRLWEQIQQALILSLSRALGDPGRRWKPRSNP